MTYLTLYDLFRYKPDLIGEKKMADQQYDMSKEMRELFEKKQEQRAAAKAFWRKQLYNPYIPNRPFDPVFFRYIGLSTYSAEHYRESYKRKMSFMFFLAPFFILGYIVTTNREKREKLWRSGTVPYEQRQNKLMY